MVVKAQRIVIMPTEIILDSCHQITNEAIGLLLTYQCNLNCKYCYIQKKQDKVMSFDMAKSVVEPLLNKDSGRLDIVFVGAETLLAFDVIKQLVEWIEQRQWKKQYRFFGSTNGTLLDKSKKRWLTNHRNILTLGLSYDGIPTIQKENRGANKIDIDYFIKTWPTQPIQMTINANSVDKMAKGVIFLLEKGAVVHPNVAYEKEEWPASKIHEYGKQLLQLVNYYDSHESMPVISQFQHNLGEYAKNIGRENEICQICGAGKGYHVIDIDGNSYPCHILSPLVLGEKQILEVSRGQVKCSSSRLNKICSKCIFVTSCPTCLACNYVYRGNTEKRDSTHCRIMQTEVRAFMKKEVLRLNKKSIISPKEASEIDAIISIREYLKQNTIPKIGKC